MVDEGWSHNTYSYNRMYRTGHTRRQMKIMFDHWCYNVQTFAIDNYIVSALCKHYRKRRRDLYTTYYPFPLRIDYKHSFDVYYVDYDIQGSEPKIDPFYKMCLKPQKSILKINKRYTVTNKCRGKKHFF